MPFIPRAHAFPIGPKTTVPLYPNETRFITDIRDNLKPWDRKDLDPDIAPLREGYGYEVKIYLRSNAETNALELFPGAQGQIMKINPEKGLARIHITELGDTRDVPLRMLRGGNVHSNDRSFNVGPVFKTGIVSVPSSQMWQNAPDQLGKALISFLTCLAGSNMPYFDDEFYEFVGGPEGTLVNDLARKLHQGVCHAAPGDALLNVLNKPDFTIQDFRAVAVQAGDNPSRHDEGVYMFIARHDDGRIEPIIGRSMDMGERRNGYKKEVMRVDRNARPFIKALRSSADREREDYHMLMLCRLPPGHSVNLQRIAEQTFVCLFETYYPKMLKMDKSLWQEVEQELLETGGSDKDSSRRTANRLAAVRFSAVGEAAKKISKWPGFTSRANSGLSPGYNIESPLLEWLGESFSLERQLWFRRDTIMPSKDGSQIPVATFRRSKPHAVNYVNSKSGGVEKWCLEVQRRVLYMDKQKASYAGVFIIDKKDADGFKFPLQGSKMELTWEVLLNGRRHRRALFSLPGIGPFEDFERAQSIALRGEWKAPNGEWQMIYFTRRLSTRMTSDDMRSSFTNYATGIAYIKYLLGEPLDQWARNRSWMFSFIPARVLQVKLDYMRQELTFKNADPSTNTLTSARLTESAIEAIMARPEHMIGRIGGGPPVLATDTTLPGGVSQKAQAILTKTKLSCDTCTVNKSGARDGCVRVEGEDYCRRCYRWGYPKCTFTAGLGGNTGRDANMVKLDARFKQVQLAVQRALQSATKGIESGVSMLGVDPNRVTVRTCDLEEAEDDLSP